MSIVGGGGGGGGGEDAKPEEESAWGGGSLEKKSWRMTPRVEGLCGISEARVISLQTSSIVLGTLGLLFKVL